MPVPKQLLRALVALGVTYVLASVIEAVNLLSAAQVGLELGVVEVPGLAAESAFDLMSRLQLAHIVTENMDARARCLESPEIDQTRARILRDSFAAACVRP
jgi:protein-arginine kinase